MNGENYFSRKKIYGLAAMVVCGDRRKILFALSGFVGSTHDNRAFTNSDLNVKRQNFFSEEEYLIANSDMLYSKIVVAAY